MAHDPDRALSRRAAMATGLATATIAALPAIGCHPDASAPETAGSGDVGSDVAGRMPVAYLPHGGGPWPFVDLGMDPTELESLAGYLRGLSAVPKSAPRALLVVSAHWEEAVPTVSASPRPPMLYDYYGFPPASYEVQWPAPGDPALAARVRSLLGGAGIESAEDASRGFDHATFVPLKLAYPAAEIPTVQLSLKIGLDPSEHLAIGRALQPLRDEGVFILGSGLSYHNMRGFRDPSGRSGAGSFDAWLGETAELDPASRDRRLALWAKAPAARQCHPREEHLLPLMVVAGAAGADRGAIAYRGGVFGVPVSAIHFG
ncbi:MAG: dioxygenase [Polyangiaceae bacterium]|nr:dioxygenase [Polyangiaceae bacterium]MBK8936388.1 dioxygenase [Polyangiaceae bacterium]